MKHRNKQISLKGYLTCIFLVFAVVLIAFMWIFQTVLLEPFYKTIKTYQVKNCAHSVAEHIQDDDLLAILDEIVEQNNMNVSLYDTSTEIFSCIYASDSINHRPSNIIKLSTVYKYYDEAKLNGGEATFGAQNTPPHSLPKHYSDIPMFDREHTEFLSFAKIIETKDSEYFVIVESEITPVTSTVQTLKVQLSIITVLIILISLFIALVSAHYISKPIRKTTDKAKELAKQNYDIEFHGGRYKELCELNNTLTYSATELKKVDSLQKELIANISHDLRTPLTMITGYSEVMRDIPGENTPENIQIVIDEANRLSQLVSDLLDISKLEAGSVTMENKVFNLTSCIKDIFKRYTKLVEQENYNIVFEYDTDVYICADELRISQVMYNLINNAVNYCGDDKMVVVRQSINDTKVYIEVIDHGNGIDSDKLPYIWDRYYKVDKEHKQAVVGTGLGLSIVKNILNQYNARYGVKTKEGQGSDFWWTFDIVQNPDKTKEES